MEIDRNKNKILIVVPDLNMPGGVANYYSSISKFKTDNISYFYIGKKKGESGFAKSITRLFGDFSDFKRTIDEGNFDLVMINPSLDVKAMLRDRFLVNYLAKKQIKFITFFRGWSAGIAAKKRLAKYLIKPFLKSSAIIVLLNEAANVLKEVGYKGKILLETTTVADELITNYKGRTFTKDKFNILFLARIERLKGVYEAVDTLKILREKFPYVNLIMAGNGSELEKLKTYTENNNIQGVVYPGYVKGVDKINHFLNADLYLFPSFHNEGMPNSVLEAMGFGLPVVTHDIGGLKDFFQNDKMGYITTSKNPQVFADLISKLITNTDSLTEISRFNAEYAKSRFLSSIVIQRLNQIFNEVIEN